jgi:hypothetical protein
MDKLCLSSPHSRSWASVDDRAHFHVPIWGGGGLRSWQESRKTIATVVSIRVKVVDKRNPYGQLSSAEITIEGSVTNLRSLDQACILENPQHERVERKIERYDDTDQLVALHIFEVNRFKNNGAVCPYVYGLVLSPSGMNTFRRVGFYECRGPIGSRYSASHFKRATVTIV